MQGQLDKFLCQMKRFNHCMLAATLSKAITKDARASDLIEEGSGRSRASTHPWPEHQRILIPLPTLIHNAPELLKATLNVLQANALTSAPLLPTPRSICHKDGSCALRRSTTISKRMPGFIPPRPNKEFRRKELVTYLHGPFPMDNSVRSLLSLTPDPKLQSATVMKKSNLGSSAAVLHSRTT